MGKEKYFYKGYVLNDVCDVLGYNYQTVLVYANNEKKTKNEDPDKIIEIFLDKIKELLYVTYKGYNLKAYCLLNNINYISVMTYIFKWYEENNEKLTDNIKEDVIEAAIKNCIRSSKSLLKGRYILTTDKIDEIDINPSLDSLININNLTYDNRPLFDVAKEREIDYEPLVDTILKTYRKNRGNRTLQQIIDQCVEYDKNNQKRYYYKGRLVSKLCAEKGISYSRLMTSFRVRKTKLEEKEDNVSIERLIKEFFEKLEKYENRPYKDTTLLEFCCSININVYPVIQYIDKHTEELTGYTDDEILEFAIYSAKNHETIYFYNNEPIRKYAKENKYNPASFIYYINDVKNKEKNKPEGEEKRTLKEIIEYCIKTYEPSKIEEYKYRNKSLNTIASLIGITLPALNYQIDKNKKEGKSEEESIYNALVHFTDSSLRIYGDLLINYCIDNDYSYIEIVKIYNNVVKNRKSFKSLSKEEKVDKAIKIYEYRNSPAPQFELIEFIKRSSNKISQNDFVKCAKFLNIDYETVLDQIDLGYGVFTSTMFVWYFGDIYNEDDSLSLSDDRERNLHTMYTILNFEEIAKTLEKEDGSNKLSDKEIELRNKTREAFLNKMDFYTAVKIYKSGIYDTTNVILRTAEDLIISDFLDKYKDSKIRQLTLRSAISTYILEAIDSNYYNKKSKLDESIKTYVDEKLSQFVSSYSGVIVVKTVKHKENDTNKKEEN